MEIERKFLIDDFPNHLQPKKEIIIEQAYISTNPVIRIRRANDDYILTVKGKGLIKREEFELFITSEQYENLKQKIEYNLIEKTRYIYKDNNITYEIDKFYGKLKGLMIAEVEFENMEESDDFIPPNWIKKELSMDRRFQNSNLCKLENLSQLNLNH